MRRFLLGNALSVGFLAIFLASLAFQAVSGHNAFNHEQLLEQGEPISLWRYVTSSLYWTDVMENWQSEYLQFTLYILAMVFFIQRGSTESKEPGAEGIESEAEQKIGRYAQPESPKWAAVGGLRTALYSNSLVLTMAAIWLASWLAQSITGRIRFNAEQLDHQAAPVSWPHYLTTGDFWSRTLQNWQSEFLAVGSMVILSVYLRQRGSPESKPVGDAHAATGTEG